MPSSVPSAGPLRPKALGIEGPVISASSIAVLKPFLFDAKAKRDVTKLLPTPPLPLTTPITFLIWLSLCGASKKLSDLRSLQFEEQLEQSCVQLSLIFFSSYNICNAVIISFLGTTPMSLFIV